MNAWDEARGAGVCLLDLDMVKLCCDDLYGHGSVARREEVHGRALVRPSKWVAIDLFAQKVVIVASDAKEFVVQIKDANQYRS